MEGLNRAEGIMSPDAVPDAMACDVAVPDAIVHDAAVPVVMVCDAAIPNIVLYCSTCGMYCYGH